MKKFSLTFKFSTLTALFSVLVFSQSVFAQTSITSGLWNSTGTWVGGVIPPAGATVTIAAGHTVTVATAGDINTTNTITIQNGGILNLTNGNTNAATFIVDAGGTLTLNGGTLNITTATINGNYNHNMNGGVIPTATWGANSNCNIFGITTTPLGGASFAQTFGNFTWNCTGQTVTQNTGAGAAMNVAGNFTINNTNSSALVFARNLNIAGNYTDNVGTAFLDFYTNGVTTTFNGIGTQTLTVGAFNTRFHNLVVNKSSDIVDVSGTPSSNIIVSNALTLTNGRIRLNTTNLSYAGTPPNITRTNGWVETQNTGLGGFFLYNAGSPATNVTFPVGDATNYQPFFIANITASGALVGFGPPTISVPSGGVGSWTVRTFAGTSAVGILDPQGGTLTAASKIHINPNYAGTWTTVTTNYSAPNYTSASAVTTGNIDEFSVYSLPIPTITSFSPTSGAAGSTAVTIIGTNFNPSGPNDVFFGAVKVTGTANPAGTQITVTVPNGATSVTPIVVRNNANGFQGSSLTAVTTKRFTVTNTPNLSPLVTNYSPSNFTTGTGPRATTVGDFNNDGNPDIAIVNQGSDNVSIRLGDGAGNFANTATIPLPLIGAFPFDIATGDFNGDGIADLATANYGTNDVSILLGDGSGDFPTVNNFPIFINYQNPVAVALADFNNDGHLDFAVGNTNGTPIDGGVSVRFGDGTGTNFTGTVDLTSADPTALAIGDFDNDGDIDIAVGEGNSSNNLYIWTNNGAGAFTGPAISTVGGGAVESMASGHFNADSNVDLVIGTITTNSAYLYTGNGAGAFVLTATVPTTTVPRSMVIGDFNGDGSSDFATAHGGSGNNVQITLGNGAGAFTTPRIIPFTGAFGISQGDFNNDGRADLAAVNFSGTGGTALIYDPTVAFKTTWITTDGEITIPTTGGGYNYSISWTNLTNAGVGDGSITGQTGNYTITGLENGSTYRIEISGTFPRFFMNNNATERTKLRTIEQWGDIAWTSMQNAFAGCSNLQITATDAPNLAGVTDMSGMFFQCTAFTGNASMNTWNTSTVTNMGTMFMQSSFNQPLNNWNTSAVVTMIQMFRATPFNQDLNLWNTANVQDMSFMFSDCPTFNGNISTWNTANVLGMTQMFYNCAAFNSDISGWNTGLVTDMQYMFTGCSAFNANISGWNTGNVTNMYNMFLVASSFDRSLATWNMGSVVNAQFMLDGCGMSQANYEATLIGWAGQTLQPNITLGAIGRTYCSPAAVTARTTLTTAPKNWIVVGDALSCPFITTWITTDGTITIPTTGGGYNYNVTWTNLTNAGVGDGSITGQTGNYTITGLENGSTYRVEISGTFPHFYINNDVTNAPKLRTIEQWGDIAWASMANAFHGCSNLTYNATDVPNLAGVTNMSYMFTNCSSFNGNASMNTWNTTSITDMSYLFAGASVFNQDISGWDVSNITNMSGMFLLASAFNQNISGWTTNNVTSMFAMFQDAVAFNQNIGGWNTTTVTNMSYLFAGATVFNQDISGWNTAAVTDMSYMFNNAPTFNQNIGGWNTAAVTNMSNMFNVATAFNQSLATWDIGNVTNMTNMLNNSGLSQANYDATLIGWAAQTVQVGVNLGAAGLQYCAGAAARTTLTNTPNNWVITGDVLSCAGYFSRKTGNWSDVTAGDGTWSTIAVGGASCDCTPVAGADVVIDAAHTITADVSTNTNSIALGGTLDLQNLTHTFTDINNNGGAGILRIGGGTAAGTIAGTTGTFFTTATNTVVFDGTALYALPNRNYPTLEITGTGGRTLGGGPVDILGNLNATGGSATLSSTATINFPNAGILPHLIQGTLGDQINLTDVNINGNTEVNAGFGFNFNGVITVNTGITFTNNSAFFQANSATSNITGAGTFVNANVVYWLSDITPSVANFDAITNANTVVYQAGIAPPRNTTYDLLFFRNTRSTTSGTIIANQIIFDNFASPSALNLATGTDITVNNNLTLANPNGSTIDFGTGNATIYVGGDLLASTVGATITHNAGIGATQLLSLAGANNALNAFNNATLSGTSQVTYNGTNQQVFASPNYQNLEIAGGGVKTLSGNTTVSGTLILGNGRLQLGGNDLTLINPAVSSQLTGAPYTTSWIETNGTGSLIRQGADTNVDFPVGDNTAVRLLTLSNTDAGNNTVRFNPTIAPVITGTNPAAGMWSINTNVATDLTFSNVGGTADATSEIHYDNAGWTALTTTGGRPPYIATGFNFTGAEVNFTVFSPSVTINVSMADLTAVNINEDIFKTNRQRIYAMEISATGGSPTLTDLVTTATLGTYTAADISNFELYYNTVDNFATATLIATSGASTGSGENISFTGFSQIIAGGGVPQYLYIAANVNAGATTGNTMSIPFLAVGNFTFIETVNPTASLGPSGVKTIADATLPFITTWITTDGTITIPTNGGGYNYDVTWTNLTNMGVGDGFITGQTGNYTITGLENGSTYRVEISKDFPHFFMNNNATEAPKLRTIEQWGSIAWTSMSFAFSGCTNLTYNATDVPNLAGVTDMSAMFQGCTVFDGNATMGTWNTATITNMGAMFAGATVFNQSLNGWNTSAVTGMGSMFAGATAFNSNITGWNTSAVTSMLQMFSGASAFNQDISGWVVNNVTDMASMLQNASAFNQNIGGWNVGAVTNMSQMFSGASAFNQDISLWNVSNVIDMSSMFANTPFNQNISGWNVGAVTNMTQMFLGNAVFNQDLSAWNVSNVTSMNNMFAFATAFNQSLATWDIGNVTNMTNMLNNSGLSQANYDATLIGWAAQTVQVGVNLGAAGLQYCAGAAARTTLTNTPNNWVITGDVLSCAGYFSRKTGNWSDVTAGDGTWSTIAVGGASCDCTPVAGADVLIDAAHTITADVSTNTNSIALGGTLDLQDLTHTFTDINNNGGAGILRIGGGTAAGTIAGTTGTFFTTATNTVEFYSTNTYTIPNRNYPNLAVSDASTKTLAVGGAVNIGGNLTVNTGAILNAVTNNVPITFPAGTHAILTDGTANLADVNVNGNTVLNNSGAYLNIAGNMAVALGVSFTNQSTNFGVNFNTLTSLLSGAGTYVNDTDAQMVYRSNITPTIANFNATALNNGVLYDLGTAPPLNTTYYNLFFRDTRSTTAGTITAYNFILDQVNPRLDLADGTNIIVTNDLSLVNTNPILDFGTGNATVTVTGNLVATAGAIIHSPAATFVQNLILNGANNDVGTFTVNPTAGTSIVRYSGVNQQVFASANYENIEILGGGIKTLTGTVTASGTLTLTNGRLQLGANDLTLSNAIVANQLTGAPYTTSWIETNGTGSLIRQGADTNVDFPVGDNTAVRLLTLSNTDAGNNTVRFNPTIAPVITGTNPAAGMWSINTNVATDLTFSNVGGTADATSEIHYDNAGWTALTTTGGRPPYIAAGIAFTGADQNFTIFTPAAATYYSVGTGNWNNAASWSTVCGGAGGAGVPTAIDNVVICTGTNITLASTSACANLTIEATGALELANQDFTVNGTSTIDGNLRDTQNGGINTFTGNVTVNTGGTFEATNINSTFNFGANITNSGTFDLQSNNTISLNGIGATITANTNMNFNGGFVGTTNFNANCSLTGAGTIIFSAAFNNVAAGVTVTNNANVDFFYANPVAASPASTFINGANAFLTLRGVNLPMNGGIFNANAVNNTVSYSRNAIQDILGGITYHHLEVYTNTKTIVGGNIIINGNLSISNAPVTVFDANNFNINIRGNWLTQVGSSFVGGTGTVTFDGNIAQSITGATTFNNLAINQVPANILTVNNPITITGTLSLTNGRLQLGPNNLTLNNPTVALQLLGTPYATSWIETNGLGSLIRQGAVTGMDFPVGDATGVRLVSMTISGAGSNTVRFAPAIAPPIVGTNPAAGMWIINRPAGTTNLLFSNVGGTADATSQIHSGGWTALATNVVLPNYTTTAGVAFTGTAQNFTIFTPSPVTPPTVQSFDIRFLSVTANTVGLQWTNGNGANRIVVASTSNVFTPPTDGVAYTVGQTIGSGRVVYIGNGSIATAYGLIPETKYFFHVFDYNGTGTLTAYNISPAANNPNSITTLAVPPQNQPTNLVISDITPTSAKAMFTIATPVPAGSVAVIRKPDIDRLAPADGQPLTVGSLFFNGQIVVFSGTGNSFDLSNLEPFTTYIVEVYAYNGSGASITYKKDNPLSAQFTTSALLPVLISLDINEKEVGDNAFTLQAIGSNFTSKTIIRWQGKDLSTTFINKNSLSAQVPRDLLSEAGVFNIAAFTPPTGGGESNALPFQVIAVTNISSLPVVSRTVPPDKNDHLLHRIAFEVAGGDVSLKEIKFTTNGSYQITDLKNVAFTLKYSTDESLDNSDVTLATSTAINANGNITFDFSRTQPAPQLPKNKTSFLLLTVNISKDAKAGNEIGIAPISFDNIQFSAKVAKRGINPASAGTTQKIISVTPSPQDYSALIKFFTELGGTDWEESWNLNNPVNTWKGVELDEDGRVFAINLPNNNLVGELSNALTNEGVLVSTNLRYLNLSGNRIKGQIPPNLGNLTDLEYLDLSKNELSGSIPPSIGNLTKLVTLWLGYNDLNSIDIDFSRLTNLRNLFLQFNEFDKLPDNIGELQNLEVLSLKGNKFKTLPSTLGRLGKLKYLDISENELEQVPSGITNLTELEGLLMHANFFKTIPSDLLNLKKLNLFTTYDNFLEFGSLEPLRVWWSGQSKMDITYSPQARIGRSQEITVEVGSPFTFNLPVTGTANRYQWFKNGVSVSVSNNSSLTIPSVSVQDVGIYTLRVTNNLVPDLVLQSYEMLLSVDCGSARQTIKPKITIEGSSVFCNNEPVNTRLTTEVRSEISRYQWFLDGVLIANANSNSIAVSDAGKYKVQIFTNDGCSLFSDAEATITKLPAFTVNITQNQGVLVAGVANRVISNYEWFLNGNLIPNASQARYLPIERGNYTVRVTDVDGCRSTSAIEVVSSVTSSEESIYEGEIKVYPNPSEAIFYLEVGKEKAIKIQLFNALGQFFNQKIRPLQGNRYEINLENQAWGMYFIEVTYQNGKVIKKLVKE